MKRSKIFLGVTTCLLAVAGVAAANRFTAISRWYVTDGTEAGHCVATPSTILCVQDNTGTTTCTVNVSGTHFKVYTTGSAGVPGNCLHEFKYKVKE